MNASYSAIACGGGIALKNTWRCFSWNPSNASSGIGHRSTNLCRKNLIRAVFDIYASTIGRVESRLFYRPL